MFDVINTAATGLQTYHTYLDATAENIANVNDITTTDGQAFRARYVVAQEIGGDNPIGAGVTVGRVIEAQGNGDLIHDPENPLADANGDVRRANVDLGRQMTDLIIAQRAFQANSTVVDRAKDAYEAAIAIGRGI